MTSINTAELVASPKTPVRAVFEPAPQQLSGRLWAQPSKNYTTRYLLAAALAEGQSLVRNIATSDDSLAMQRCLRALGARVEVIDTPGHGELARSGQDVRIRGFAGAPCPVSSSPVDVGNAGAVLRFLLGIGALAQEVSFATPHPESLGRRPNGDLLAALEQLGCRTQSQNGCLPITLWGSRLHGGRIQVSGAKSSQFLSALLFLAPLVGEVVEIEVVGGLVSKAPVRQTLEVLKLAGVDVEAARDLEIFRVSPQSYRAGQFTVNGDWPGSAAILAAAAVTDSHVELGGLFADNQGESLAAEVLKTMGADIQWGSDSVVRLKGAAPLNGVEFDGDLATDAVLALMGPACLAQGRTRFYGVSNLRLKECDRISEPIAELRKLGVRCWEGREAGDQDPDAILIEGNPSGYEGGIEVNGRGDHRVIMLLSILALRCRRGLTIQGAHHVAKSYPMFFAHLAALGARLRLERENAN